MKKLLFINNSMDVGGTERLIFNLAVSLERVYEIHIICLDKIGDLGQELINQYKLPVVLINRKDFGKRKTVIQVYRYIKKFNIDIIHTHNQTAMFFGSLAGFLANVKINLNTMHSKDYLVEASTKYRLFENKMISTLNKHMVCVSDDLYEYSRNTGKISLRKLKIIWNGIDASKFTRNEAIRKLTRDKLGLGSDKIVLGIVARLHPVKNHKLLIDALHGLSLNSGYKLLIIGDGELRENLTEYVRSLNLDRNILFLGSRTDIEALLSAIDIFVLPSLSEGLPLTILEAMAGSLPVIATDVGMNSKIIKNSENGFIIPNNDKNALMEKIKVLIDRGELREKFGRLGSELIKTQYSLSSMLQNYQALYEQ